MTKKVRQRDKSQTPWAIEKISWGVWIKREYKALEAKYQLTKKRADNLSESLTNKSKELETERNAATLKSQQLQKSDSAVNEWRSECTALRDEKVYFQEAIEALKNENKALSLELSSLKNSQPLHKKLWQKLTG